MERELPMDEGWAFYNFAIENDGFLRFSGVERETSGYIKQAAQSIIDSWRLKEKSK